MLCLGRKPRLIMFLCMPILQSVIIPLFILDIWVEIYHHIYFPLYKIPCIERRNYIQVMDRAKLPYLTFIQKLYCMYCGYANGLFHYRVAIGWATEKYRCGIQHAKRKNFVPEEHQKDFSKFWDEQDFIKKYCIPSKESWA